MSIYNISYDLNSPGQNYEKLRKEIESLGVWCHYLDSTYLVKCNLNVNQVQERVNKHLDTNDRVIICKVEKPIRGWLSQKQWDWIEKNL